MNTVVVVAIVTSGIVGLVGGWFAHRARTRDDRARQLQEAVQHGRELERLGRDAGPEEEAALAAGEVPLWDLDIRRGDLHRRLAGSGAGL